MKLHVASSGGIGGLRIGGLLDTDDLAPDLAATARALVTRASAGAPSGESATGPLADGLEYELTWSAGEEAGREVTRRRVFNQASTPPEVLDSLQALIREVVRRRAAARGARGQR